MSLSLNAANHYGNIFSLSSTISNAWLRGNILTTIRTIRDLDENTNRIFLETYLQNDTNDNKNEELCKMMPTELQKYTLMDISPSGDNSIRIDQIGDKPIISFNSKLGISLKIDASNTHGKVIGDSFLGGYSWSTDEKYFIYIAQEKESDVKSSFEKSDENTRNIFDYKEDWGEKYDGVNKLVLCILNTQTGQVMHVPGIDSMKYTVGQPILRINQSGTAILVYTAWSTLPRKLGMIYCYQRPAHLYGVDITSLLKSMDTTTTTTTTATNNNIPIELKHTNLTPEIYVSRSPRFCPNQDSLLCIGSISKVSSHNSCFELLRIHVPDTLDISPPEIIINKVMKPASYPDDFPGLFCDQLPRSCFLSPDDIVLTSQWGSSESVLQVNLQSRTIQRLNPKLLEIIKKTTSKSDNDELDKDEDNIEDVWNNDLSHASCSVVDVANGCLVFTASSPITPQVLGIHHIKSTSSIKYSKNPIISVSKKSPVQKNTRDLLDSMRWKMFAFQDKNNIPFDMFMITPLPVSQYTKPLVTIIVVHGGPHAVSLTSFLPSYIFLTTYLQCNILHCNYRGSIGYGLDSIQSLLGNIGNNDVQDVITCIEYAKTLQSNNGISLVDADKLCIVGGSHGGFLSTHLIGQFPELFQVAAVRNPVTNIPPMFSISDIPDWCAVETMGEDAYDFTQFQIPTLVALEKAYKMSPIYYINKVKTPTLLCIGGKDRRVPPSQGIEYYHALQSRGIPSKMLFFPDDVHALDKPATEFEQWVEVAKFIEKYTTANIHSDDIDK